MYMIFVSEHVAVQGGLLKLRLQELSAVVHECNLVQKKKRHLDGPEELIERYLHDKVSPGELTKTSAKNLPYRQKLD